MTSDTLLAALGSLRAAAQSLGYPLSDDSLTQLRNWSELVVEWRRAAQLTAIRSVEGVLTELVLPALYAVRAARLREDMHIVDFGCGNGCTGVALTVLTGVGQWYLLDRDEKKLTFCRYALGRCRIWGMEAISADDALRRGLVADVVLARALPRQIDAVEAMLSLLAPDGRIVRWLPASQAATVSGAVRCGDSNLWMVAQSKECFNSNYVSRET